MKRYEVVRADGSQTKFWTRRAASAAYRVAARGLSPARPGIVGLYDIRFGLRRDIAVRYSAGQPLSALAAAGLSVNRRLLDEEAVGE